MTHVVCVGDVMIDVLARLPGPLAPNSDTPATVTFAGGGAGANVAAWLVAAGAEATFVGRVGADAFGQQAVGDLEAAGVRVCVDVDADRPTGVCLVLVGPDGERTMIPSGGANAAPAGRLPEMADCLYVSGYSLLGSGSRDFAVGALSHARERGWSIAVDVASAAPIATAGVATFLDRLGTGLVVLANLDEAALLTGREDPAAAAVALARRCGEAVVTRGADGATYSDGVTVYSVSAVPAEVVDSTGAGDAFTAGFLATSGDPVQRLTAAAALAARVVGQVGARPSIRADR